MPKAPASNILLRFLPSVDELLRTEVGQTVGRATGEGYAAVLARRSIEEIRQNIVSMANANPSKNQLLNEAEEKLSNLWGSEQLMSVKRVINATGVIIHTNLGRAPLSAAARRALIEEAGGYCTLEYDLETGKRGMRAPQSELLIRHLTGAEAALVVNNCAAAAFFVLTVFAAGGAVVISRGELVEIGGDFRVPDVLAQSGAVLREVGTTNRTSLADYERAIGDDARVILRVHPSNYRIIGFTSSPPLAQLAALARKREILFYEDIGSGALNDLGIYGLKDEPTVAGSISAGVDIVTFSGDKLIGGPQSGIIAGRSELIEQLRSHPLYRALRVDKLTNAALEATLDAYRRGAENDIPVMSMVAQNKETIAGRAAKFLSQLNIDVAGPLKFEMIDGVSAIGGGAAPGSELNTVLIAVSHENINASSIEHALRRGDRPVVSRIENGRVLLDLRTVQPDEEGDLLDVLRSVV